MDRRYKPQYYSGVRLAGLCVVKRWQCLTHHDVVNKAELLAAEPLGMDWARSEGCRLVLAVSLLWDFTVNDQLAVDFCEQFRADVVDKFPEQGWQLWAANIAHWLAAELYNDLHVREETRYALAELNGQKGGA